jgi:hypothetical protein
MQSTHVRPLLRHVACVSHAVQVVGAVPSKGHSNYQGGTKSPRWLVENQQGEACGMQSTHVRPLLRHVACVSHAVQVVGAVPSKVHACITREVTIKARISHFQACTACLLPLLHVYFSIHVMMSHPHDLTKLYPR